LPTEPSLAKPTIEVEFAMAKRKLSTFERLQRGQKLSRRERKEIERRFQRGDPAGTLCMKMWLSQHLKFTWKESMDASA
jgi:hypothetical protein